MSTELIMADESAQRNGAKWLLVVLLVTAVFAALFIAGYFNNLYKRNSHEGVTPPTSVNSNR
jgi:heme/copper-type cytochrome/quinol oxidase subunit 3